MFDTTHAANGFDMRIIVNDTGELKIGEVVNMTKKKRLLLHIA